MGKDKKKQMGVLGLVILLVAVLIGGLLFVGAVSGWFDDPKVTLDAEYYNEDAEFLELGAKKYDELLCLKKSFVVFVDQEGCNTADRLREYVTDFIKERGITVYKMMFSDMKESLLHNQIKYYPSVAIVDKGVVRAYLRADSDEDAELYNDYDAFRQWIEKYL